MGPQVSEEQLNRVKSYVDIARGEGATVLVGGEPPQLEGDFGNGYFFQPTIFGEVKNQMRIAQEEIFGPVVSVITFKDEEDLIKQANETVYGLSAGIWTRDITRAHRFAREINAAPSGSTPTTCQRRLALRRYKHPATAARWASTLSKCTRTSRRVG